MGLEDMVNAAKDAVGLGGSDADAAVDKAVDAVKDVAPDQADGAVDAAADAAKESCSCTESEQAKRAAPMGRPFLKECPAASYSPTRSPLQYHRR